MVINFHRVINYIEVFYIIKDDEGFFKEHFPEGVDELYFVVTGVIKNIERLEELYELFAEVLKELCNMGSASTEKPGIVL